MKKNESVLKSFRILSLSKTLTENRDLWINLWWQEVNGLADNSFVEKNAGVQFSTAVIPMIHLCILVNECSLTPALNILKDSIEGSLHQEESLVVTDLTNAEELNLEAAFS